MEASQYSTTNGLEQYWRIFKRRLRPAIAVFSSILLSGIFVIALKRPAYEAQGKLKFKKIVAVSSMTEVGKEVGSMNQLTDKTSPLATEAEVINSYPVVKETIDKLSLHNNQGKSLKYREFIKQLSITEIEGTDVLKVTYKDANPQKSAKVVNSLMQIYLTTNIKMNRQEMVAARRFIEEQLPKAADRSYQAEIAVRKFKEDSQIVDLDQESSDTIEQIHELQKRINEAQSQVADSKSQSQLLRQRLGLKAEQALLLTKLSQSPEIQEVSQKLQAAESALATQSAGFTKANPVIANLEQEVKNLKNLLNQRIQKIGDKQKQKNIQIGDFQQKLTADIIAIEAKQSGLVDQISTLTKAQSVYKKRAKNLPKLSQQLQSLVRKQDAAQATYSQLLKQLQDIRVAENQSIGNVQIIANAIVPDEPVNSRSVSYLASALLALLAAIATAYILELTDKSIKTVEEAKQVFGYTWLGIIPSLEKPKKSPFNWQETESSISKLTLLDSDTSAFPINEAYRMLQSNLKFLNSDKQLKTIVVTSSVAKEGKSTVAANLAAAMAQVGHRVVLIDGNLHQPSQHKIWDVYNNIGLSNIIAQQIDPRTAIQPVMLNLDLLTAGVVPPSPATLLGSQRMNSLIEYFDSQYDFVIIDTPALDFAADAPTLGQLVDGILLVVKLGVVDSAQADFTKDLLMRSGQNVLGIIINGVISEQPYRYYAELEGNQEAEDSSNFQAATQEGLWETVSRLQKISRKNQLPPENLNNISTETLKEIISSLERDLHHFTLIVKEEEEELKYKRQIVRQLEQELSFTNSKEVASIEEQLFNEQEENRMLYKTLIGQRRNLEKHREMLHRYQEIINYRQTQTNGHQSSDVH
jgi:capsular exopolysaccharide synthesis family protein